MSRVVAEPSFALPADLPSTKDASARDGSPSSTTPPRGIGRIPRLAFGLYKVPNDDSGKKTILRAIQAGYRHFDCATVYGNEAVLGQAIAECGIPRSEFFLASKVWNDAQRDRTVRESVEDSLRRLGSSASGETSYWDLFYIHWPVPDAFVRTYDVLRGFQRRGGIRYIGLSNFHVDDYETLLRHDGFDASTVVVNQMEVSPFVYRPDLIRYFRVQHGVYVAASKALHRGQGWDDSAVLQRLTTKYGKTAAQILLRWSLQKDLIVIAKTSTRMRENRDVLDFELSADDMTALDSLTTDDVVKEREALEVQRKTG